MIGVGIIAAAAATATAGAALGTGVWLARGALRTWRWERAGLAYEESARYDGVALRAGAALLAVVAGTAGAAWIARAPAQVRLGVAASTSARHPGGAGDGAPAGGTAAAGTTGTAGATVTAAPSPASTPGARFVSTGAAYGGVWWRATVGRTPVRIWIPDLPGDALARHRLRVVLGSARLAPEFGEALREGEGGPFALLALDPAADSPAVRAALRDRFPLAGDRGWGILGVDADAPAAVHAALFDPDRYAAGVGVSGRYAPPYPRPSRARGGERPHVLLTTARHDRAGAARAREFAAALGGAADVVTAANADDPNPGRARYRLIRQGLVYLTGTLTRH